MNINERSELAPYRAALNALGFSGEESLEQLIGAAQVAGPELAAYLGVSVNVLSNTINQVVSFANTIPLSALNTISQANYSLGVAIDHIPRPSIAPSVTIPPVTSLATVNLIANLPAILDQGDRGTCVAHAALACYEHYLAMHAANQDLSE